MSQIFLDENGFNKKTEAELVSEFEADFKEIFGDDVDVDSLGANGQFIGFLAKAFADLWDGAEEIYTARNPAQATGTSLDAISFETDTKRLAATATRVENVLLYGVDGTVVEEGKQAKKSNNETLFSLQAEVTIDKAAFRDILIEISGSPGASDVVQITLDSETVQYTVQGGDTDSDIVDALIANIATTPYTGNTENVDGVLRIYDFTADHAVTADAFTTISTTASVGIFLADALGPLTAPANSLTVIATSVTGWDSVNNPNPGTTGRAKETDAELRIRRATAWAALKASDEGIAQYVLQEVEGVTSARVTSNRAPTTDADGRPPHSFETVVEGGDADDIALAIWTVQPAGIQPYGTTLTNITDSEGQTQEIGWSRPENQYIWVKVERSLYGEEQYPDDGDDQIKAAIVEWAATEYIMGVDVIRQRLSIPIYSVEGILNVNISLDATDLPTDTPTYAQTNLPMSNRQIAVFSEDRITVEGIV